MTESDFHSNPNSPSRGDALLGHRIGDANLNRAQEALRTLEDLARFGNLALVQTAYKKVRHDLQDALRTWDQCSLLIARDAQGDVGRTAKLPSEFERKDAFHDVAAAAAQRLQQSLRSLEEVAKVLYPATAQTVESIRYRSYDLNAALLLALQRDRAFLQNAKLYVLADCTPSIEEFRSRIESIAQGGAELIQIREKHKDASEILAYTECAIDAIGGLPARLIMNDRADLALLSRSFGLHVGQTDLSIAQARKILPSQSVIGLSTHSVEQIREAILLGADYIGCGPTFPSSTKAFDSFAGLAFLREAAPIASGAHLPAFAIGGIHTENVEQVLDAGFRRIVVGSAIWNALAPRKETEVLRSMLDQA